MPSQAHVLRSLDGAHRTANIEVTEPGAHPHSGISTRANTPVPAVNSFGVSTVLPGYGILPKKVRTPQEAYECVKRDGAVILTGLTTSGCIRATCIDTVSYGFRPIVVGEACGDRDERPHEANLFDMNAKYADVVTEKETIEYLARVGTQTQAAE